MARTMEINSLSVVEYICSVLVKFFDKEQIMCHMYGFAYSFFFRSVLFMELDEESV